MADFKLQDSEVYFRGSFMPFAKANLSIASAPILYGLSVYSVLGAAWNDQKKCLEVFRLKDHYNRLVKSAKILDFHGFTDDWTYDKFEDGVLTLLRTNSPQQDVLVRITVFIDELMSGTKMHGLKNSVSMFVYPASELLPKSGAHVCVSSWQRSSDNAIPSRAKVNGSYVNASLMKNEALLNGYDDAIALDERGHVSEATVANLFMVRDGVLVTPDPATDTLEGITRDSILTIAKKEGIPVSERSIDRSELYIADELCMSGSSVCITPIISVDKRPVANGKVGPITAKLMQQYEAAQRGTAVQYGTWLTEV